MSHKSRSPNRGLFITGTDTAVGKTFIGTGLLQIFKKRGIEMVPRKPVESGCNSIDDQLIPQDALALRKAAKTDISLKEICPYRLKNPLSPERAALLEGVDLRLEKLHAACQGPSADLILVEGAGGFYSPLASDGLNADLAQQLNLPILLVASNRLGTINHVLLTVQAIESRKMLLAAIVLNQLTPDIDPAMDNMADLQLRLNYPVITIPHYPIGLGLMPDTGLEKLSDILIDLIS
jgi:dethiobiotin synthetase